jgi:hypothetical protein
LRIYNGNTKAQEFVTYMHIPKTQLKIFRVKFSTESNAVVRQPPMHFQPRGAIYLHVEDVRESVLKRMIFVSKRSVRQEDVKS